MYPMPSKGSDMRRRMKNCLGRKSVGFQSSRRENILFFGKKRCHDYRDGEYDKCDIRDDIRDSHSEEKCIALTTLRTWIGNYLVVMGKWVAFAEIPNESCKEGDC